jgi:outer membrane protein assembly factor BamE (lipoprotein component of BamABCDE complex)
MANILRESSLILALKNTSNQSELKGLEGEQKVLYELGRLLPNNSTIIWNPNLLNYESDILIIDESLGFIFVEVKHWSTQFINRIHQNGTIDTKSGIMHPLKQTDNYRSELKNYINSFIYRNVDVHKIISSVVFFPNISAEEFKHRIEVKGWPPEAQNEFLKRHFFADDFNSILYLRLQQSRKFTQHSSTILHHIELQEIMNSLSLEVFKETKEKTPRLIDENNKEIPYYPKIETGFTKENEGYDKKQNNQKQKKNQRWLVASAIIFFGILAAGFVNEVINSTSISELPNQQFDYPEFSLEEEIDDLSSSSDLPISRFTDEGDTIKTISESGESEDILSKTGDQESQVPSNNIINNGTQTKDTSQVGQRDGKTKRYISLGSTKENVKEVLGKPSTIYGSLNEWVYDYSSISFDNNDLVIGWDNSNKNLNVYLGKAKDNSLFSMGSSKETVITAMGTPTTIYASLNSWIYDYSSIDFDINDHVIGWDNSSNNLNVSLGSEKSGSYFSIGSTKEEVIAAMGTPTTIYAALNSWVYGNSSVDFDSNGHVVGWDNFDNNLNIK